MPKSQKNLCWITYKAIDVLPGMYISKQLAKTPREVVAIWHDDHEDRLTIVVACQFNYLSNISYEHPVDVLCYSNSHEPVIEEVL